MFKVQRKHKFLWIKGTQWYNFTCDGMFEKVKLNKNEKLECGKQKRRYFKGLTRKDIKDYQEDKY